MLALHILAQEFDWILLGIDTLQFLNVEQALFDASHIFMRTQNDLLLIFNFLIVTHGQLGLVAEFSLDLLDLNKEFLLLVHVVISSFVWAGA